MSFSAQQHSHLTRWNPQDVGTKGYWGPVTASIDWCEANYPIDWLPVAEPINTFTNLIFFWLAWRGWQEAKRQKLSADIPWLWAGMGLVGIGSFCFHGSLRYEWQLADELPMVYASTLLVYTSLTAGANPPGLLPLLVLYDLAVTIIYLYHPDPVFHQVAYALTVATMVFRIAYLLFTRMLSNPEERRKNMAIRRTAILGCIMYGTAFAIWNADNWLCPQITQIKQRWGMPYSWLLEGHGWWHAGTAGGSHWGACSIAALNQSLNEGPENFDINYIYGFIPYVARVTPAKKGKKRR